MEVNKEDTDKGLKTDRIPKRCGGGVLFRWNLDDIKRPKNQFTQKCNLAMQRPFLFQCTADPEGKLPIK